MPALFLLVLSLVLFLLAGFAVPEPNPWRHRLVCLGLAAWVGASLVGQFLK